MLLPVIFWNIAVDIDIHTPVNIIDSNFEEVTFQNVNLNKVCFSNCNFINGYFNKTNLNNNCLNEVDLLDEKKEKVWKDLSEEQTN